MNDRQLVDLSDVRGYEVGLIGGKASSLQSLGRYGWTVPPAVVLTSEFFGPWYRVLQSSPAWRRLTSAPVSAWAGPCAQLVAAASRLEASVEQAEALRSLAARAAGMGQPNGRFAVRSSSPVEDSVRASFAGEYETLLGVTSAGIESAVRQCFAASLRERVLIYARSHGLNPFEPALAVIVQAQLASDVAGVAFSINPVNNDYDEAVLNANWGLGETVVSGTVVPDHFVVDKTSGDIIDQRIGDKQRVARLADVDGIVTRDEPLGDLRKAPCLKPTQVAEITRALVDIEGRYGHPVDIEWAYGDDTLYLLQARPITVYVPLAEDMQTEPGQRRRLYMDISLSGGLTTNEPISALGTSWMKEFLGVLLTCVLGRTNFRLARDQQLWLLTGARMYQDLSNSLWLVSTEQLAERMKIKDALIGAILANIDADAYRSPSRPPWARWTMLRYLPGALWRLRRAFSATIYGCLRPENALAGYRVKIRNYRAALAENDGQAHSFSEFAHAHAKQVVQHTMTVTGPALACGLLAGSLIDRLVPAHLRDLGASLHLGHQGNEVVDMGIELYALSGMLDPDTVAEPKALARALVEGQTGHPQLQSAWNQFIGRYGWRGPGEVDLANPRHADDPELAIMQMREMLRSGDDCDPGARQRQLGHERSRAHATIVAELRGVRRWIFMRAYKVLDHFVATRDTPKHDYLLFFAGLRKRALAHGQTLVAQGRLDRAEDVLDLDLAQLRKGLEDPAFDLKTDAARNRAFIHRLNDHVRRFPAVIDSRGRIHQPSSAGEEPGVLRGTPVSAGTVRGRVKLLHSAKDQHIEPGDILVAYTTDPGWTPLFVNAGAVLLEVGGILQHGAVVAREYGKPCVVGIHGLFDRLSEGELVEVDGALGLVRKVGHAPRGTLMV